MTVQLRVVFLLLVGSLLTVPVQAQNGSTQERTVRVGGEATVTAVPDQVTVRFGIVTRAEEAEPARRKNAEAAKSAMDAVRGQGVPESKIQMESLRLRPRREYNPQTNEREEKGFEASRQVVVELDSLDRLPTVIARVVQRGANRLNGIEYDVSDRTALRNSALQTAARNAREKAQLLVTTLEAELGPIQQIQEQSFGVNEPSSRRVQMQFSKASSEDAAPEPDAYAAGEIEVTASVQVSFAIR